MTQRRQGKSERGSVWGRLRAILPNLARLFAFLLVVYAVAMVIVALRRGQAGWPLAGLAIFVAGGLSNWIDRLLRGSVVDFLNVGIGPWRTGVFNVADVAILAGAVLFAAAEFRRGPAGPPVG